MNVIKFSHDYYKLAGVSSGAPAKLLQVIRCDHRDLSPHFIEYDTAIKPKGNYPLPAGKQLLLIFRCDGVLFTTVRRWTPEKNRFYINEVGNTFKVEIKGWSK